jgi:hypothetical protein
MISNILNIPVMKSIKIFVLLTLGLLLFQELNAQKLNTDQEQQFKKKIEELLESYKLANQTTSDWVKVDQNLINQLRESFVFTSSQVVFNDLLPDKVEGSRYLNPVEYTQFALKNYPEGLDVGVEILEIKVYPKEFKKGQYRAIVKVKKTVKGLYSNIRIHKFSNTLQYYVRGSLVENFIDGVRIERVLDEGKHKSVQANKKLAGVYVGGSMGYNYNLLYNPDILSNGLWIPQFGIGKMPMYEIHFMFTKGFGLAGGLRMGKYSPGMVLQNYYATQSNLRDIDNDSYDLMYEVDRLEEVTHIDTYDIPVFFKFRSGRRAVGLYLDMGVVYTKFNRISYSLNGTATRKGYYPDLNVMLENIPEYNYYTNRSYSSSEQFDLAVPPYGLSGYASVGFSILMFKRIMMRLGVSANYGITDLSGSVPDHPFNYSNTTGNTITNQVLHSASADFGLYLKLF